MFAKLLILLNLSTYKQLFQPGKFPSKDAFIYSSLVMLRRKFFTYHTPVFLPYLPLELKTRVHSPQSVTRDTFIQLSMHSPTLLLSGLGEARYISTSVSRIYLSMVCHIIIKQGNTSNSPRTLRELTMKSLNNYFSL